jgi:predicted DNA-binding transcriptional regulator AlpA
MVLRFGSVSRLQIHGKYDVGRKFLRVKAVIEKLGLKDRNALDAIRRGCKDFPKPVKMGNRTIAWFEDEILAYGIPWAARISHGHRRAPWAGRTRSQCNPAL